MQYRKDRSFSDEGGDSQMVQQVKHVLCNRLTRKIAVFAASFVLFGAWAAIHVASPEPGQAHAAMFAASQMITVQESPVPAALTDWELAIQLEALLPEEITVAKPMILSKGSYQNAPFSYMDISLSPPLQEYTYQRCEALGLEYELILAIMWRESRFQVEAVGTNRNGTQDSGLMQINDVNRGWLFEEYGIDNLLDPYQNIDAGTTLLARYFSKYSENYALMAYQYGEQGMLRRAEEGMTTNAPTEKALTKRNEFRQQRLGF